MTEHKQPTPQDNTPETVEESAATPPTSNANTTILNRREFMTLLLGSGASIVLASLLADPLENLLAPQFSDNVYPSGYGAGTYHWAMVIDLSKCVGCDYCVYACQAINDTREDMRWNIRIEDQTELGNTFHLTRPCLHCVNAPCVSVCPVYATYNRDDGLVVMDYDICIGCRYCQTACPYGARVFNWEDRTDENPVVPEFGRPEVPRRVRGVVEKCTFCIHRIDGGMAKGLMPGVDAAATPACVNICPVTARYFGNLNDPNSTVSQIVSTTPTLRLREDLGAEPSVYYIPAEGMVL